MRNMVLVLAAMFLGLTTLAMAQSRVPINKEEHINNSLVSAAVAEGIRQNCPSISARFIRALNKARELEKYALAQGYTEEEIKAFIGDKTEKKRIVKEATDYVVAHGVVAGDEETFCALGRAEIESGSLIGYLLFSWR